MVCGFVELGVAEVLGGLVGVDDVFGEGDSPVGVGDVDGVRVDPVGVGDAVVGVGEDGAVGDPKIWTVRLPSLPLYEELYI